MGYVLFAVLLVPVFLYLRFPSDDVKAYLQARAEGARPPLSFSVGRLGPSVLGGLKLEKASLAFKKAAEQVLVRADSLLVRPALGPILRGQRAYAFSGSAYKGDVSGRIVFKKDEPAETVETEITFEDIHVGDYGYLSFVMGRPVQGALSGKITFTGPASHPLTGGTGEARLRFVDGGIGLLEPFLTFESIDFKEVDMELNLQPQRIHVARVRLRGEQLQGTLSGMILLKDRIEDSHLNLSGSIEPFAAFFEGSAGGARDTVAFFKQRLKQGALSFTIRGTLKAPEVNFT